MGVHACMCVCGCIFIFQLKFCVRIVPGPDTKDATMSTENDLKALVKSTFLEYYQPSE